MTVKLGDVGGDAPGLVAGEQLGRRPPAPLVLAVDVGQRLPVAVADDEAGVGLFGSLSLGSFQAQNISNEVIELVSVHPHIWHHAMGRCL